MGDTVLVALDGITIEIFFTALGDAVLLADDGIAINNDFTAAGAVIMNGDFNKDFDGNDNIVFAEGVFLSAGTTITLDADLGGIETLGDFFLESNDGITLKDGVNAQGRLFIDTDMDRDGSGTFTLAREVLNTNNFTLDIIANDLVLNGSLATLANINISTSDGEAIGC